MNIANQSFKANRAPYTLVDPGDGIALRLAGKNGTYEIDTAAAETRLLRDPTKTGERMGIVLRVDGGDCVVTADTAINQAGNTVLTFNAAGETIFLEAVEVAVGTYVWRVLANDGVDLS